MDGNSVRCRKCARPTTFAKRFGLRCGSSGTLPQHEVKHVSFSCDLRADSSRARGDKSSVKGRSWSSPKSSPKPLSVTPCAPLRGGGPLVVFPPFPAPVLAVSLPMTTPTMIVTPIAVDSGVTLYESPSSIARDTLANPISGKPLGCHVVARQRFKPAMRRPPRYPCRGRTRILPRSPSP